MSELPSRLHTWMASGRFTEADGVRLFYRATGPAGDGGPRPWLVCLHGFPTSSWDWHRLLPLLERSFRVLVFDFPGYGLSDKPPRRDYSLLRQLDAGQALLHQLKIRRFHLLAHDMGNSVACELLYRREQGGFPFDVLSVCLLNGGVYMDLHRPLLTQRLLRVPVLGGLTARLSSWRVFRLQYPRVYADPAAFSDEHYREQWSLLVHNDGRRALAGIAGYMRERVRRGERWTGPLERLDLPLTLVWGREDPIAVPSIAERLKSRRPETRLILLEGVGHYPQLEAPAQVALALSQGQ